MTGGFDIFAALMLSAAAPAHQSPTFVLECESIEQADWAASFYEPMRRWNFVLLKMTVDTAAKTALIEGTDPDGTVKTVLRNLIVATPQLVLMCQADECQKDMIKGPTVQNFSLTRIDLQAGSLSREARITSGTAGTASFASISAKSTGECRRL